MLLLLSHVKKIVLENENPDCFECGSVVVTVTSRGCGLCSELYFQLCFLSLLCVHSSQGSPDPGTAAPGVLRAGHWGCARAGSQIPHVQGFRGS